MEEKIYYSASKDWFTVSCYARGIINAFFEDESEAMNFAKILGGEEVILEHHHIETLVIEN